MSTPSTALPRAPDFGWDAWLARAHLDLWLTVFLLALGALGLCVLYSASGHSSEMVVSQGQRLVLGLIVMLACAQVPPEVYRATAPWFYGAAVLLLVAVLLLGTMPFCAIGLWIGTLVKGEAAVAVVNLVYLPMALMSGLWLPLFVFPAVIQKLAVLWPAWHLGQMALGVVGQVADVRYGLHAGVLLAMTVCFLSLAALRLRNH